MVRRLAAIMFTDMVGSTQLAQRDEKTALQLLREQEELAQPLVAAHHGRLVKSTGDGMLVEFGNALEAVQCAVEFQRQAHERGGGNGGPAFKVRIGIHVGDVEERGTDILGDSVNIAARVEPLAEPGGICLSGVVHEHVLRKVPYAFERLGARTLRGVLEPVEIYRIVLPWATAAETPSLPGAGPPRLAVLPFDNFSPDPEDGFFADGLTEELITLLAQLKEMRVIARTSAFQYRTTPKPVSQIGAELGVSSILEGSVRKSRDQIRVTAQLIDVATQEHLWAKTYDRKLDDIFAVQTEVARKVAEALKITIRGGEAGRLAAGSDVDTESYLAYLKGRTLLSSGHSEEILVRAREQFERAISIDPSNAGAHSGLADTASYLSWAHSETSREDWDRLRRSHAVRAIELNPELAEAHCSLAAILWDDFEFEAAEKELRLALGINPSYALAHHLYAAVLEDEGRAEEALRESALAVESDPQSVLMLNGKLLVLLMLRQLDEALPLLEKVRTLDREGASYYNYLAIYRYAGGDFAGSLEAQDRLDALRPGRHWDNRVWIYAAMGAHEKARALLMEMEGSRKNPSPTEFAQAHAVIGDLDGCFRWLEQGVAQHQIALQLFRLEPTLEPVRKDPRFAGILRSMNLRPRD
jgi:adenylate cyclase